MPTTRTLKQSISLKLVTAALLALSATLCSFSVVAQERIYLVEVIVFENLTEAKKNSPGGMYFPKIGSAIGLTSDKAATMGFALLDEAFALEQAAETIRNSGNYRLLKHFAWRQPGLDDKNAKAIRINIGQGMKVYLPEDIKPYKNFIPASAQPTPSQSREITTTTVNGSLKVRLGRFLHLDTKLVFSDAEKQKSYRLSQSRKMRSSELHYIDNPRFGLLVKILPLKEASN